MVKNHLKRIASPPTWNILRKNHVFISKPNPGAHAYIEGMSLNTIVKEDLGLAQTTKEVKKILHDDEVLVDGKRRHDEKFNLGLMDVISFPKTKQHFRVGLTAKGKLAALALSEKESSVKLVRIINKKTIKGNKTQLQFSDGRTMLVEKDAYKTNDSLLISLPDQKIQQHYPFAKNATVLIFKGKYAGRTGVVDTIAEDSVTVKSKEGAFATKLSYAFTIGDKKPAVTCSP